MPLIFARCCPKLTPEDRAGTCDDVSQGPDPTVTCAPWSRAQARHDPEDSRTVLKGPSVPSPEEVSSGPSPQSSSWAVTASPAGLEAQILWGGWSAELPTVGLAHGSSSDQDGRGGGGPAAGSWALVGSSEHQQWGGKSCVGNPGRQRRCRGLPLPCPHPFLHLLSQSHPDCVSCS